MPSTAELVDRFRVAFARLDPSTPLPVAELYDPDVRFVDPFHRIDGRDALAAYFARLNKNLDVCTFTFHHAWIDGDRAMLTWTMNLTLRRGPRGPIVLDGASELVRGELVCLHRDYFDAGAMVYEQIPVLGAVVRAIKRAM